MKLSKINFFLKFILSILLSLSCIYLSGTHNHLNYFLLFFILTLFFKRNLKKVFIETLPADFVLSFFFLSFSSIEYASIQSFRERAFHLAPLYPSLCIFILIVYYSVLKEENFRFNVFLNKLTYFPFVSLLLGLTSGISTEIDPSIGIFSSLHLFSLVSFFAVNFFLIIKYIKKNDFIIKFFPIIFFIFTLLICKSKFAIFTTFSLLLVYAIRILRSEKFLNYKFKIFTLNFSKIFTIFLAFLIIMINIFSFNMNIAGFNPSYIDKLITYRLTINSSFFKASKQINNSKFMPQILPNREYKIIKNFSPILENQVFIKERLKYFPKTMNKKRFIFLISSYPHNSLIYYLIMHEVFWTILLLSLIAIFSFLIISQSSLISFSFFIIFCGLLIFESIPYINSIMLVFTSYFLIIFSNNIFKEI